jgi:hypothetical protein
MLADEPGTWTDERRIFATCEKSELTMRTQSFIPTLALFCFAGVACRTIPQQTDARMQCDSITNPAQLCSADGVVFVQAVDDRRVLIAIDAQGAQQPDGLVDHLFLYTASEPYDFRMRAEPFPGHVEYRGGFLRVVGKDGRQPLLFLVMSAGDKRMSQLETRDERRFSHSIGLSHYTGWRGLRVTRLNALHASAQCDGPPGACVEVDGIHIEFPA